MAELSPVMKQYCQIKEQYSDALIFFRLGDFYEMFFEDAILASRELEIALTGRDCGQEERAPMCGVPFHSAEQYIDKLISKGYKVAICEQLENPSETKGLVKRGVVRVVTPGTLTNSTLLEDKKNNFLAGLFLEEGVGAVFADISTGEVFATQLSAGNIESEIIKELSRYSPSEILLSPSFRERAELLETIKRICDCNIEYFECPSPHSDKSAEQLFRESGISEYKLAERAAGALLDYLSRTQMCAMPHISRVTFYPSDQFMDIDFSTKRNLEIISTMRENKKRGSLLGVIDRTKTAMGGRLMKNRLERPLTNCAHIQHRLSAVAELKGELLLRGELRELLADIKDIERLTGRAATGSANPRDVAALGASLELLPRIKRLISEVHSPILSEISLSFDTLEDISEHITRAIAPSPPISMREGGIIKDGYNEQVDSYRRAMKEGVTWLSEIEREEREATGIKTLKVGYTKVFGYYIEVSKGQSQNVPEHYVRKQTLVNCERYITGKLKEIENVVLGAQERNSQLEYELFCALRNQIRDNSARILGSARQIAELDVFASLAEVAEANGYEMPLVNYGSSIRIKGGRHPVVEAFLSDTLFVPNDTYVDKKERVLIITGPNMAGKSTYMRQVALIVLLAQIGSFVPAESAEIGVVDKIFTRVGAADDLAAGQSTFMVEMREVANILNNATGRSLLILDEIGRGTSTYDGLSIAWAVVEHIANGKKLGAKTLFATHYHELTDLEAKVEGVKNYCIAVKKQGDDITFLRKIIPGGADDSFGIEVAKLAGVKGEVIKRAKEIVTTLESTDISKTDIVKMKRMKQKSEAEAPLLDRVREDILLEIKRLDINSLTGYEALETLDKLKKSVESI